MKKIQILGVVIVIFTGLYFIFRPVAPKIKISSPEAPANSSAMKLESSAFENYKSIPKDYTCHGASHRPPLSISGVPKDAVSLAIIMDDPDAAVGNFTHWVIFNIPSTATHIDQKIPESAQQGTNSNGMEGYDAPCPSTGTHRYFFTLYALDAKLGLDGKATKKDIEIALQGHILGQSLLIGTY